MDILAIGDVHGCYYTLKNLVTQHWNPESMLLIQVGDLVNKGPHSVQCIDYWLGLEEKYPDRVVLIKGNHEHFLLQAIKRPHLINPASRIRSTLKRSGLKTKKIGNWLDLLPLKWENDHILITHAGIAQNNPDPYHVNSPTGVLLNKGPLKNIGKLQIKGHSIVDGNKPVFSPKENAWYIDTGAWTKKYLTAIHFSWEGQKLGVLRQLTDSRDK